MGNVLFCRHCGKPVNPNATVCLNCGCPPATGNAYCGNCGAEIKPEQAICLNCGIAISGQNNASAESGNAPIQGKNGKSATTATILTCLLTGAGQMYLGQVTKGIALLLGALIIGILTGGVVGLVIWIVAMVDAYKIGKRLENGETVGQWQFF